MQWASNEGKLGGRHWDPPVKDLDRDFSKLRPRTFTVDRDTTLREKTLIEAAIGDIAPVRMRGNP